MSVFRTEIFDLVKNEEYEYYKLSIDGICQFDDFLKKTEKDKQEKKNLMYILSYMENLRSDMLFPKTKFRLIVDNKRKDLFEFKKKELRVYVLKQKPNIYIVLGGYKRNQKKDIKELKSKIKEFKKGDN